MEFKTLLPIFLSALAVAISLLTSINANSIAKETRRRSTREQLSNTLEKLTSLQLDILKIKNNSQFNSDSIIELDALTKQKHGYLLDHAAFLAKQIPDLVQVYELNTIACCLWNIGRSSLAEEFYLSAINKSNDNQESALTKSSYAHLLYQIRRIPEGKILFKESLSSLSGDDNLSRQMRGNIHRMAAICEYNFANDRTLAQEHIVNAIHEYSTIDNTLIKDERISSIYALQQSFV